MLFAVKAKRSLAQSPLGRSEVDEVTTVRERVRAQPAPFEPFAKGRGVTTVDRPGLPLPGRLDEDLKRPGPELAIVRRAAPPYGVAVRRRQMGSS